jgi:branched-chain amino acid transport system permease protein
VVAVVWSPATAPFVLFTAIILALLLRPRGLFATGAVR